MTPIDLLIHSILTIICNKTLTAFKGCYMMLQFSSYGAPLWCLGFCFVLFNIDHAFDMAYFLKTANMSHICLISRKLWTSQIPAYQVRSKPQSKHTIHSILWVRIILKNGCQPVCSTSHKFLSCTWRSSKMLMVLKFFFNLEDVWTRVSTQPLIWTHRSGSLHPKYCLGSQSKVCGPHMGTLLDCRPIFEWYMARFVCDLCSTFEFQFWLAMTMSILCNC